MPPLIMPCCLRKLSSACTNTSKIALPIPRTSYFAEGIYQSCQGVVRKAAAYQIGPAPAREAGEAHLAPRARGEVGIQAQLEFRVTGALRTLSTTAFADRAPHPNPLPLRTGRGRSGAGGREKMCWGEGEDVLKPSGAGGMARECPRAFPSY